MDMDYIEISNFLKNPINVSHQRFYSPKSKILQRKRFRIFVVDIVFWSMLSETSESDLITSGLEFTKFLIHLSLDQIRIHCLYNLISTVFRRKKILSPSAVVIGAGFAGISAARALRDASFNVNIKISIGHLLSWELYSHEIFFIQGCSIGISG